MRMVRVRYFFMTDKHIERGFGRSYPFLGSQIPVSTQSHGNLNSSAGSYGWVCRFTTIVSGCERAFQPCITPGGINRSAGRCMPMIKLLT